MALEYGGMAPLFQVFDLPTSLAFYQNMLDFELLESTDDGAMLRHGDTEIMLNTAYESHERPNEPVPDGYLLCFQHPVSA